MSVHQTPYAKNYNLGGTINIYRMGYGSMRITGEGIWGPPKNLKKVIALLRRAVDLGVNFIDTADSYGPYVSEQLIAEALFPYPKGLIIATKGGFLRGGPNQWTLNGKPQHLESALYGSLKRLKLETIDLYQLHRVDQAIPIEETIEFLRGIKRRGLVKQIGLSEVSVEQLELIRQEINIVSIQNKYSVDNRRWEKELEFCRRNEIAFIPWYPLNAGNVQTVTALKEVAGNYGATPNQVALSWLLHHSPNIIPIPGTTKLGHLEQNLKAVNLELTKEDIDILDNLNT